VAQSYSQTLEFLYSHLPMFQRIGAAAYRADLSNTIALCKAAGNPERDLKCIHVAGTNGKGSTSHLLASIFMEAGYKVGLYTSPHLKDFRERITINGKMISKKFVVDFTEKYKKDFKKIEPSFFEMTVVMAFEYFKKQKTDINIIEVGMGGRLDSTNVIIPELSVITTISKDHVQFLGNDLREIAREKGGIIKSGVPILKAWTPPSRRLDTSPWKGENLGVVDELKKIAKHKKSKFILAPKAPKKKYECELKGDYQQMNISTVLKVIEEMKLQKWKISEANIKKGISKVVTNTNLQGRWQTLSKNPLTICDIGHNEEGIKEIVKGIKKIKYDHLHFVIGTVNDKDVSTMLSLLPKKAIYYYCQAKIPRAMKPEELKKLGEKFGLKGEVYGSVKKALKEAKKNAIQTPPSRRLDTSPKIRGGLQQVSKSKSVDSKNTQKKNDLVFVGGSAFVVAEVV
jgi:dihydrofolate synthase/folylpolyglutamate synthase